jgi:hypothetical protein
LRQCRQVRRLGDLADVGIGYVTGANDFFHLAPADARRRGIPERFLRPAVRRGRALKGLRFTKVDWDRAAEDGEAGYLLLIENGDDLPESVRRYLREGEARDVPAAYKCRARSPWFRVPHVHQADAFLSYMSGAAPRLVANDAAAVAPNSLHVVRFRPRSPATGDVSVLWQTSMTRLSAEIEGHALGGGMLKLEPTEAERVLVPWPDSVAGSRLASLADELDELVRGGGVEEALVRADAAILQGALGLGRRDCQLLRRAATTLRERRYSRSGAS